MIHLPRPNDSAPFAEGRVDFGDGERGAARLETHACPGSGPAPARAL